MSLMCYWALARNMIRDPYRLEDCPLHLVSTALFVLVFPFFRGDWTETVKLLVIVKLWSNSSTENFQLSEETYIRNSWFLFLHLVQRCRTALGTDKAAQFLPLSKAANLFICVPPIVTKAKNFLLWVLNQELLFFLVWCLLKTFTMGSMLTKSREVNLGPVSHTTGDCTLE